MWNRISQFVALLLAVISLARGARAKSRVTRVPISSVLHGPKQIPIRHQEVTEMDFKSNCGGCKHQYTLGPSNTVLHVFSRFPGMSYLEGTCPRPQCQTEEMFFFSVMGKKLSDVRAQEWKSVIEEEVPDDLARRAYAIVAEAEEVEVYELLPRQEKALTVFAFDLEDATPEDIINAPTGKLPRRWT